MYFIPFISMCHDYIMSYFITYEEIYKEDSVEFFCRILILSLAEILDIYSNLQMCCYGRYRERPDMSTRSTAPQGPMATSGELFCVGVGYSNIIIDIVSYSHSKLPVNFNVFW